MPRHRFVEIAGFSADPSWSELQTDPDPPGLIATIKGTSYPTSLLWRGVGYDGDDENAVPVNGTGLTFDAALVYKKDGEYRRFTSIFETIGTQIEAGRDLIELDVPANFEGWFRMIALTDPGGLPATHLLLSYEIRRHSQ